MELLRIAEVAKILALSDKAVYKLISSGQLTVYCPSPGRRSIRLLRSEVEAFIQASARPKIGHDVARRQRPTVNPRGFDLLRSCLPKASQN